MLTENELVDLENLVISNEANSSEIDVLSLYVSREVENIMNNTTIAPYLRDVASQIFTLHSIIGEKVKEQTKRTDEIIKLIRKIGKDNDNA